MKAVILVCGFLVLILGCASNRPVRGSIARAEVGSRFSDFRFVDDEGVPRSLRNQLGDFTVLALTRCEADTHGPAAALVDSIVAEHRKAGFVKVVGVDVHWSEHRCAHESECHLVGARRDLVSICDATGAVRRLYNTDRADRFFLIGPSQRILMESAVDDVEDLRQRLDDEVRELSKVRADQLAQEYQDISFGQ